MRSLVPRSSFLPVDMEAIDSPLSLTAEHPLTALVHKDPTGAKEIMKAVTEMEETRSRHRVLMHGIGNTGLCDAGCEWLRNRPKTETGFNAQINLTATDHDGGWFSPEKKTTIKGSLTITTW